MPSAPPPRPDKPAARPICAWRARGRRVVQLVRAFRSGGRRRQCCSPAAGMSPRAGLEPSRARETSRNETRRTRGGSQNSIARHAASSAGIRVRSFARVCGCIPANAAVEQPPQPPPPTRPAATRLSRRGPQPDSRREGQRRASCTTAATCLRGPAPRRESGERVRRPIPTLGGHIRGAISRRPAGNASSNFVGQT